jgi:type VI secretion system protein ImpL
MNIYWGSAVSLMFFMGVGVLTARYLNFSGQLWYMFMGIMSALGLTASAFFYYFQNKFQERRAGKLAEAEAAAAAGGGAAPAGTPGGDGAFAWVREANLRLAKAKPGVGIENLPMVFVIGDRGTAKTSTILNSGLEPELLAGQVYQDNAVVSTRGVNIFYARDSVFVEAGGAIMASPSAWKSLVTKLRPGRLKSLVGSGGEAPRAVLLCFDLENFTRQGAAEAIAASARYLQERLGDVSQALGISLPVYVLFTRADRIPYFADFVNTLGLEEAGQVVGVTLPMRPAAGVYAEAETHRLTGAFNQLFYSLCDHRLRLLPRESDLSKVPGTYEFPREFRKLRNMLVQFLVDVGRPSQLRSNPFLRGFYFSGVRAVQVQEAPVQASMPAPQPAETGGGATRMFRVGFQAEQRQAQMHAAAAGGSATRRIPQWLFLGHLFNDVILADHVARGASGSSTKTSGLKRVLLATAAGLCLLYAGLLTLSYFGNRSIEQQAIEAIRAIPPTEAAGGQVPSLEALQRLDTVRQALEKLTDYEANGAPWSLRWGLYAGNKMLPQVRRNYYNKFRQMLFGGTQDSVLAFLQRVPAAPGANDDYGYAYDSLKAYLLTASEWKRSSDPALQAFLAARLYDRWTAGRDAQIGKDRLDLARAQFAFYAKDLHNGNPYNPNGDGAAIDHARAYLAAFGGIQRVYRFLLSEAAKRNPPMTFNQKFPGSGEVVSSPVEVAWAFTKDGWTFMKDQIKRQNFLGEEWVLGPSRGQVPDQATLEKGILDLYTKDYVEQWRNLLRRSNVIPYANLDDASRKLNKLTSSDAPLLALLWWTTQNTAVDLPGVAEKFRAVHAVVPPSGVQQYIVPPNQNYNGGLLALQQSVERAARKEPDGERAMRDSAQSAKLAERQLATTLPPDPEARIQQRIDVLLQQPIDYLDALFGGDLRSGGARFCAAFNPLTTKFPFNPTAVAEVTLQELADILQPGTGRLWTFYNESLKSALPCQNGQCTSSGNPPLNPQFVSFISQLMRFSRALYGDSGNQPNYAFSLRPQMSDQVEQFDVTVNGALAHLRGGQSNNYVWPGTAPSRNFLLSVRLAGGSNLQVQNWDGLWSVFRFFADADRNAPSGNASTFTWLVRSGRAAQPTMVGGRPLTYEFLVDTGGAPSVFSKEFLSTLKCVVPLR